MSRRILLCAVSLLAACAPRARILQPLAAEAARGARADFDPETFEGVFRDAVHAVRARGFDVVSCDPALGAISTSRVERDAPCGGTSCLVRETAAVKLGHRRARVTVTREIWDAAVRTWRIPDDAVSVASVASTERELVAAAVDRRGRAPAVAECGGDPCRPAACVVASAPRR